jgi:hypothetical protein
MLIWRRPRARCWPAEAEYGELSRRCREHVLTHHDPRRLAEALCGFIAGLETRR